MGTWTISGLAMGTDYHFLYKYVTTMGDSQLSPPLAVKTPYNKTDLDEFRDSLGLEEMKEELKEYADSVTVSEDEVLENKLHVWHWDHMREITLEGSDAGPDRGYV